MCTRAQACRGRVREPVAVEEEAACLQSAVGTEEVVRVLDAVEPHHVEPGGREAGSPHQQVDDGDALQLEPLLQRHQVRDAKVAAEHREDPLHDVDAVPLDGELQRAAELVLVLALGSAALRRLALRAARAVL